METDVITIEQIDHEPPVKIKAQLTVPLIASWLAGGIKPPEIASNCGVSKQAVYQFIERNADELAPLIDTTDGVIAMKYKQLSNKATDCINRIVDKNIDSFAPKDLFGLNVIMGTAADKYRLMAGKSTANISTISKLILQADATDPDL